MWLEIYVVAPGFEPRTFLGMPRLLRKVPEWCLTTVPLHHLQQRLIALQIATHVVLRVKSFYIKKNAFVRRSASHTFST